MNRIQKRILRFETLEERQLLAVCAGLDPAAFPAPLSSAAALPPGQQIGDLFIASTIDADGDGFIGPGELALMSAAWFQADGSENWNPACDYDGDGFIGPGDLALLSSSWFKPNGELPESTLSYTLYPNNTGNWIIPGGTLANVSAAGGVLTFDTHSGSAEALCGYSGFPGDVRVSAGFRAAEPDAAFQAGIKLAVQDSGACYYAEFQNSSVSLYYVSAGGAKTLLASKSFQFAPGHDSVIWAQRSGSRLACGIGDCVLLTVTNTRLSGGEVGFNADQGVSQFRNISVHTGSELYDIAQKTPNACVPQDYMNTSWWRQRHEENIRRIEQGNVDMLMVGDSITHRWDTTGQSVFNYYYGDRNCLNMGFGGDQTGNVLWRLNDAPMEKIHPKLAVVLIGINNLWEVLNEDPADVALGTQKIIEKLEDLYPDIQILVLDIFPVGPNLSQNINTRSMQTNARLAKLLKDDPHVTLKNINDIWIDANGRVSSELLGDNVHPTELGYWRWAAAIEPEIAAMLGVTPK